MSAEQPVGINLGAREREAREKEMMVEYRKLVEANHEAIDLDRNAQDLYRKLKTPEAAAVAAQIYQVVKDSAHARFEFAKAHNLEFNELENRRLDWEKNERGL